MSLFSAGKRWAARSRVGRSSSPQARVFKSLRVWSTSDRKMEHCGASSVVMKVLYRAAVVKKELSRKVNLSIY